MAGQGLLRTAAIAVAMVVPVVVAPGAAGAGGRHTVFTPGAAGVGDPYFPLDGNGGYDVRHYDLDVKYDPSTDVLEGEATIKAVATQNLSAFNLDLQGLDVHFVTVDGRRATFSRDGNELTVKPKKGLVKRSTFVVVVKYSGVPETLIDPLGQSGVFHTDDGAMIVGQPHVAATWFPVNDHPTDAASYSFDITVPAGLEAIANGVLTHTKTRRGWTTWSWSANDPMASYLAGAAIGEFDINAYKANGIKYWDAIDPDLFDPLVEPISGTNMMLAGSSILAYMRLVRTIAVPAEGATLSFWAAHDIEASWDFMFVEAHTVGLDDWTTLPAPGITSNDTGFSCPFWLGIHPFLTNYQTDNQDGTCSPTGTPPATGSWNAVTGGSDWRQWTIDLSAYAGSSIEVSITYAGDDLVAAAGVAIDDIVVSTGEGTTSFEDDGDLLDGWTVSGPPDTSPGNESDWFVGTVADLPPPAGAIVQGSFARQPEILDFLSGFFGRYPWKASGGIVDDLDELTFALENQTRPIYSDDFFTDSFNGDSVVVHELAHQWFGDELRLERWQDIWLNEGFATYAEWLWAEYEGFATTQQIFENFAFGIPAEDPFWTVVIGDPGADLLFDIAVYWRGGMALHALRLEIGDDAFFTLIRKWAKSQAGGTVTTAEFIRLAERVSGKQLDDLFDVWLYTPAKPEGFEPVALAAEVARGSATTSTGNWLRSAPAVVRAQHLRFSAN
jgi:hypothetical protein